jgi:CRISPR system Cascade subunit CasA
MMTNLTTYSWIPVILSDGHSESVSLEGAFVNGHHMRDLAPRPHERISVMRLLVYIAHAALDGPVNHMDWRGCRDLIADAAVSYLRRWRKCFALDRFLQVDIKPVKTDEDQSSFSKLDCSLATEHNHTLFDNGGVGTRSFDAATLALNLLTFQNFSVGGRIGVGLWNNQPTRGWKASPKPASGSSSHAPCVAGNMLHTFLVGPTLLDTIHLNLLNKEIIRDVLGDDRWGRPIWEQMPAGPNLCGDDSCTLTYLGRLVPLSRAVRLDGNGLALANGLDYPTYENGFREPCATIVVKSDGTERTTLRASLDRATWRQLHSLTVRRISKNGVSGPLALSNLDGDETFDLWTGALVTNQSKILDTLESSFPNVPVALLSDAGQRIYQDGVQYAENAATRLWFAVREYRQKMGDKLNRPEDRDRANLMEKQTAISFWTDAEQALPLLLALVKNSSELGLKADYGATRWGKSVLWAMRRSYQLACPRETARQMQAYVAGLNQLNRSNQIKKDRAK